MSELIESSRRRKDLLKHMILQIHQGMAPDQVRTQIVRLLARCRTAMSLKSNRSSSTMGATEEILRLCDLHSAACRAQST